MKKIIFNTAVLLLFISQFAVAQTKPKLKTQKTKERETVLTYENFNPGFFEAHIPFLGFDFSASNSTIFANSGAKFKKKDFFVDLAYNIAYVNQLEEFYYNNIPITTANSIYEHRSPKSFNLTFGYMVYKKLANTKAHFRLKSSGYGKNQVTSYMAIKTQQTKYVMADLGLRKGFNHVLCTGKELVIEESIEPPGFMPPTAEKIRTMMDYTMLQFGVSFGKTGYWEADIPRYGLRRCGRFVRYYADFLLLLNSSIDPIYNEVRVSNNLMATKYELNNSPRSKFGFCVGATLNSISRFGINKGVEFGYLPGIKGDFKSSFSFLLTTSISFGKILK
jgi:hypothetical protein